MKELDYPHCPWEVRELGYDEEFAERADAKFEKEAFAAIEKLRLGRYKRHNVGTS